MRKFVASPNAGSHHNRGTAVDVTLFDLAAGREADVGHLGGELSERAHSLFPGGTSLQRWHRLVLRTALERQGFRGLSKEWWHFRHISRSRYPIINVYLSDLSPSRGQGGEK
jgi:D-alanyl-D-alanine dipeptidase